MYGSDDWGHDARIAARMQIGRIFGIILGLLIGILVFAPGIAFGQSYRVISSQTSSGNIALRPDICALNYATYAELRDCLDAGGESPVKWNTSPSAVRFRIVPPASLPSAGNQTQLRALTVPSERQNGDVYYGAGIYGYALSSSNGTVANTPSTYGSKLLGPGRDIGSSPYTFGFSSPWQSMLVAYNAGIPPSPPPVQDDVCLTRVSSGYPENGKSIEFQMPWQVAFIPGSGNVSDRWEPVGLTGRWPGPTIPFSACKIFRGSPSGVGICYGMDKPFTSPSASNPDMRFVWCSVYTDGTKWESNEVPDVELIPQTADLKQVQDVNTTIGALENGSAVNKDLQQSLRNVIADQAFDEICDPAQGVVSCIRVEDRIVITRKNNDCMTKEYWHDGNISGNGVCIGSYDRDWPSKDEPFSEDKAWKWEPGEPATSTDIAEKGKNMTCLSTPLKAAVKCASKIDGGGTVSWPSSAGGGTSTTNPGTPGGQTPPTAPPCVPGVSCEGSGNGEGGTGNGEGGSLYTGKYPDGFDGIMAKFMDDVAAQPFIQSLQAFVLPAPSMRMMQTGEFCFAMPLMLERDQVTSEDICVENWLMDILGIIVLAGAGVTAFKIVMGI